MAIKRENYDFFVMPLQHVRSVKGIINRSGLPKPWGIPHENGHKTQNNEFLVMYLKYVPGVTGLVNHLGTAKLQTIANENNKNANSMSFTTGLLIMYKLSQTLQIVPEPQKCGH
jgi:hypothetical protein